MTENSNPVVDVARSEQGADDDGIVTFSTGVRVRLHSVSASLISKVTAKIKDPRVPTWYNKAKGRDERNPNDPAYLRDVERAAQERGNANDGNGHAPPVSDLLVDGIGLVELLLRRIVVFGHQIELTQIVDALRLPGPVVYAHGQEPGSVIEAGRALVVSAVEQLVSAQVERLNIPMHLDDYM